MSARVTNELLRVPDRHVREHDPRKGRYASTSRLASASTSVSSAGRGAICPTPRHCVLLRTLERGQP
jgi:hypothetical protein